ncbi:MAG: hypothetical protein LBD11_02135 [Candidatus Peribacteria bacterium]|jgi:hypothetical protein|nr:hypothetical protein [Candidatus Peribacteria bacterium]
MYTAEHKEYRSTLATQLITSRKISEELRRVLNSSQLEALYDKLRKKRNEILTEAKKTNEYLDSKRAHDQYKGNQKLISKIMDETGLSEQEAQEVLGTKEDVLDLPEKIEKVSLPATQDLMETLSPSFIIDHLRKILTTPGLSLEEKWEKLKFSTNDLQPVGRIQWRNIFKAFTISEEKAKKLRTKISSIHEANKGKSDLSYLPLNFIEALINIYNEDISSTEKQKKTEIFIDTFLRFNGLSHSTRKGADHHSDNETQ